MVFLPDTALLVPGAAGRADPAAALRDAALVALRAADPGPGGRVLVLAPGHHARTLPHPVVTGLGAAGLLDPQASVLPGGTAGAAGTTRPAVADVAASVALVLLRAAGVDAPVDVREIARTGDGAVPVTAPGEVATVVVVGSLSARHGPDAPLADDPRAPDVDAALLAALAASPGALAAALDDLGASAARDLAVTGWAPWRAALALLDRSEARGTDLRVAACTDALVAGAQHAVALWLPVRPTGDGSTAAPPAAGPPTT
ncbi:hypothetical protein EBM89_12510 [Cellulomonas triticagri]|uniref:Uncharacterized protein n=1 Tax=Cellulomonas triticagri TaxID=2483352 RepID=A0A3M2JD53_9CELL|nr:hypothetical protein EBM89_12510 [Cellulomonas triticagri]